MEQIYNGMIEMMRSMSSQPEKATMQSKGQEEVSFRDLLTKKHADEGEGTVEEPTELSQKPPVETEAPAEQELDLEEQLLAAAISVLQRPVVPAEQMTTAEGHGVAVEQPAVQAAASEPGALLPETGLPMQDLPQNHMEAEKPQDGFQLIQNDGMPTEKALDPQRTDVERPDGAQLLDDAGEVTEAPDNEMVLFRSVKDVLVKVGEAARTEGGEPISVPVKDQVGEQIAKALDRGEMRLTVQLNPQNLGRVEVELTLTENGSLHVELRTENQMTQQLLEKETAGLQHMLIRNTQQEVQVQVTRQQESQQQAFEDGRQGGHHQNPQQDRREERHDPGDFLHQLRLGLVPLDEEAS